MCNVIGLPSAVGSLNIGGINNTVSITWISPEGDVTGYCVDIINSVSSVTLHSQCGINVAEFCYTLLPDVGCYELIAKVTPVNIAGNGSSVAESYSPSEEGKKTFKIDHRCVLCTALQPQKLHEMS